MPHVLWRVVRKRVCLLSVEKRSPEETGCNFLEQRKGEINKIPKTENTVPAKVSGFLLFPAKCLSLDDCELSLQVSTSGPSGLGRHFRGTLEGESSRTKGSSAIANLHRKTSHHLKARIWVFQEDGIWQSIYHSTQKHRLGYQAAWVQIPALLPKLRSLTCHFLLEECLALVCT